jgi:hypothetical protein
MLTTVIALLFLLNRQHSRRGQEDRLGCDGLGGQWCTSPGYAYAHESVADAFVAEAKRALVELYGDDPSNNSDYSRVISAREVSRLSALIDPAKIVLSRLRVIHFVVGKIVHDDDIALPQGRGEKVFDIGPETRPVHRPIEHAGRGDLIVTQGGNECRRHPMAVGRKREKTLTTGRPLLQRNSAAFVARLQAAGPAGLDASAPGCET